MKDLVAAARMGDQQAMTQLYEATNRKAYYLAVHGGDNGITLYPVLYGLEFRAHISGDKHILPHINVFFLGFLRGEDG